MCVCVCVWGGGWGGGVKCVGCRCRYMGAAAAADTDIIYASHVINQHTNPNPSSTEIDVTQPLIERFF